MSTNSSSSNDSLTNTSTPVEHDCLTAKPSSYIFTTYAITFIFLLLPLCIFILHHGFQQWRQNRSTSSVSHSDCFTYHMVVIELVGVCGCVLSCCRGWPFYIGVFLFYFTWNGETLFHVLTCVERYLAVVHPITYLSLRNQRGIRIRNISISCAWLLSFSWMIMFMMFRHNIVVNFFLVMFSLTVISLCSLSVLCVLIRPGPGEQGGGRERVDQSKLRAFYTIMTILGVLVLRFSWGFIWSVLYMSNGRNNCAIVLCHYWFNLPSSLVLPLLFLHRAGKLVCCKNNIH